MTDPCTIQLFGGLRLRLADRTITRFRTQKTGALLAYLAYHRHHSHAREVLIEIFWPDTEPESGRHNLSHALSSLRSLLEPPGVPAGAVLIADRFTVELNPDAFTTDVAQFEQALRVAAQARNSPEQEALLTAALDTVTGELLPGYYEDWIQPARERIAQRLQQALMQRDALRDRAGRHPTPTDGAAETPQRRPASPALPTGTVTALLTDIEGSTALWERTGDAFKDALSLHHALLRDAFRRSGGHEINEAGDSFLVLFPSVADALAAAIAGQNALHRQAWPESVGALKVRMALYTGDIEFGGGEYHGLMLHRAARVLAAGHGGQILCSETSAGLLRRDLEPQIGLLDLGQWRLRDIPEPERLFQITYPQMPVRDFPPLNASPAHRTHLPLQFTRFFGREAEIARILEILASADTRLLTLTGPGGTGKTRLSLESVARYAQSFEGAIWFVPLADLSDPHLIPQAIVQAMGRSLSGGQEPLDQAVASLSRQPTLLILDNVEQLVDGGAQIVQSLLERVPSLRIVATSRQLLGLPGEVEFAVAPLPTPSGSDTPERLGLFESVRLFVDRAQSARPDFRVTNHNAPAVAELCERLEGLPLAIELAAARALVLTPSQMLAQLSNRFEFLVSRKRGVAERQRTLRAAIDWSYKLLAPDLQRFFAQLCVFRGGWSLEAAEAVCDEPMALDMLAQLRECSLVTTQESERGIRFRMLETLREYAESQLLPDELAAVRERHARFSIALAEEADSHLRSPDQLSWLARLTAEHDNLRAALGHALVREDAPTAMALCHAMGRFWVTCGYLEEAYTWLEAALKLPGADRRTAARAGALYWYAFYGRSHLTQETRRSLWDESLGIFRELGNQEGIASTLLLISEGSSDPARKRAGFEESLQIRRELGNPATIAASLLYMGIYHLGTGNLPGTREAYSESLAFSQQAGDLRGIAIASWRLAQILSMYNEPAEAIDLYDKAQRLCQQLGDLWNLGLLYGNLSKWQLEQGDFTEAAVSMEASLKQFHDMNYREEIARRLAYRAEIHLECGQYVEANQLLDEGIALARDYARGEVRFFRGYTAARQGDLTAAYADLRESLRPDDTWWITMDIAWGRPRNLAMTAEIAALLGRFEVAAQILGAEAALQAALGILRPPLYQSRYDRAASAALSALGEAAFQAAWETGRSLSQEQVRARLHEMLA